MTNIKALQNIIVKKLKRKKRRQIVTGENTASETIQEMRISGKLCRICLEEDETIESPFITPCLCSGSCKYIHLNCLRSWTDSKKQIQTEKGVTSYYWDNLECEICKTMFELNFELNGEMISVLDVQRPQGPYMLLESEVFGQSKAIHCLDFSIKQCFMVGRRY